MVQLDLQIWRQLLTGRYVWCRLTRESSRVQTRLAQTLIFVVSAEPVLTGTSTSTPSHQHFRYPGQRLPCTSRSTIDSPRASSRRARAFVRCSFARRQSRGPWRPRLRRDRQGG